ncbi:MAG: hypothetical protein AAFX94_24630 [Myxococcota bacterium]
MVVELFVMVAVVIVASIDLYYTRKSLARDRAAREAAERVPIASRD